MEHIAIQKAGQTFDDWSRLPLLCRCSLRRDVPHNRVRPGDIIYILLSSKGIRARATVSDAVSKQYADIDEVRQLCRGTRLYEGEDFWRSVRNRRYATVVWLKNHEILKEPIYPKARSYGAGWIVLDSPMKKELWLGQ